MDRVLVRYCSVMDSFDDAPVAEYTGVLPVERAKEFVEQLKNWPVSICHWSRDTGRVVPAKGAPVVWRWKIGTEPTGYSIHWLYEENEPAESLEELVFVALGAASACWLPSTGAAEFDSRLAWRIGCDLVQALRARGAR